jgi:hypothetical protein
MMSSLMARGTQRIHSTLTQKFSPVAICKNPNLKNLKKIYELLLGDI